MLLANQDRVLKEFHKMVTDLKTKLAGVQRDKVEMNFRMYKNLNEMQKEKLSRQN
jgi:uncharacterized coiled-coil protein SlyX